VYVDPGTVFLASFFTGSHIYSFWFVFLFVCHLKCKRKQIKIKRLVIYFNFKGMHLPCTCISGGVVACSSSKIVDKAKGKALIEKRRAKTRWLRRDVFAI